MDTILITNCPRVADYADKSGVSRIMVDLEILGKNERQGHLNTVISKHKIDDVAIIKKVLVNSDLLVRVNPINPNSSIEINTVIESGADIVMLPMFTTPNEVGEFVSMVDKRAKVCLLLETPQALARVENILEQDGIDEIHIGLNDLHLGLGLNFMFELLGGGIVEYLASKIKSKSIKFGFGGIARLGKGTLDSSLILSEHYRLGSEMVILSRDFKGGHEKYEDLKREINLESEVNKIYTFLNEIDEDSLQINKSKLKDKISSLVF